MPAGSERRGDAPDRGVPALPHRFRPLGIRFAAAVGGALLLLVTVVVWLAFPGEIRHQFTGFQRSTVVAIGVGIAVCGYAVARSRVDATPAGLTVVNGFRTRRLEWSQVLAVSLRPGSPWAMLDVSEGITVAAMGIQGSDGTRAAEQVRLLRALIETHSPSTGHS